MPIQYLGSRGATCPLGAIRALLVSQHTFSELRVKNKVSQNDEATRPLLSTGTCELSPNSPVRAVSCFIVPRVCAPLHLLTPAGRRSGPEAVRPKAGTTGSERSLRFSLPKWSHFWRHQGRFGMDITKCWSFTHVVSCHHCNDPVRLR